MREMSEEFNQTVRELETEAKRKDRIVNELNAEID